MVRRQKVYSPRRWRPASLLVVQVRWPLKAACQRPSGWGGKTEGPPTSRPSRPLKASAWSRTISASSRYLGALASSRLRGSFSRDAEDARDDWRYVAEVTIVLRRALVSQPVRTYSR